MKKCMENSKNNNFIFPYKLTINRYAIFLVTLVTVFTKHMTINKYVIFKSLF
jgi:hypothetical protein